MNLSDNEKRDAIKLIQEGKPLPEKYRFLLFDDDREVELVWNGKTQEVCNLVLPFQTIEHIDEPRSERITKDTQLNLFDTSGRQMRGWTNKLIWGDNKLILSSLKNGPMRQEIEKQGGLKLVYIDPPFDVGADFSMNVEIGDESFTKKPSVIEEVAYRDTWGKGADSFIAMLYERLKLIHELLADDGSIYVHCDYRVNALVRLTLDEIFGKDNFVNEIIWKRGNHKQTEKMFLISHDNLMFYSKTQDYKFNSQYGEYEKEYIDKYYCNVDSDGRKYQLQGMYGKGSGPALFFGDKLLSPPKGLHWRWTQERINTAMKDGIIVFPRDGDGMPRFKDYLDGKKGVPVRTIWADVYEVNSQAHERIDYPTQKPESLLERVINASTNEGDLVADFFCGSGTTLAAAEKLGRKWIGTDIGRFGVHTSRKRLIQVQRELKKEGKDFRAFEILNLGKYEREHYVNVGEGVREQERRYILNNKERQFVELILSAYKAQPVDSYNAFVGKKRDRLVAVGPINTPVASTFIDEAIKEAKSNGITKFDVLGFDYEMGIDFSELSRRGVDVQFKVIPREVFDRRAVEKGYVKFYDVAYIEVKPIIKGRGNNKTVAVELCDFSVFYNQDNTGEIEENLKPGGSKIKIQDGKVIKLFKEKNSEIIKEEILTKKWTDWVDYWSVDFNMENKKEIVRVVDPKTHEEKEEWTGNYIFENEWQSFRTKKDRKLEVISAEKEVTKGRRKVAVKVVDIFGNDTTKVIEVNIP